MYCPQCGADEQHTKAYCRQCGKWLGGSPPEARMTVMIIFNCLSALFGAASAIALFSNLSKGAEWPIYLAGTFCIVISIYQTISFLFALSLRMRPKQERDSLELNSPDEVSALRPADISQFVRAPSATENTTELLERKKR